MPLNRTRPVVADTVPPPWPATRPAPARVVALEALRGWAAVVVVVHHFLLAFQPRLHGMLTGPVERFSLAGTPLFVLANGSAMVVIFFVLSGYVLALKGHSATPALGSAAAAARRWFRLTPLILAGTLLSWLLFHAHAYRFEAAAAISGSEWLRVFAFPGWPQDGQPGFAEAALQGVGAALFFGGATLNTNLWTMWYEYWGSLLVLGFAALFGTRTRTLVPPLCVAAAWLLRDQPLFVAFLIGMLAAFLRIGRWRPGRAATAPALLLGIYLCGYCFPVGLYAWVGRIPVPEPGRGILVLECGAALLLLVFATDNMVSRRFQGRLSRLVGRLSFPLYVVHTLAIGSAGSAAYAACGGSAAGLGLAALAVAAVGVTMAAALAWLDERWLGLLAAGEIALRAGLRTGPRRTHPTAAGLGGAALARGDP